MDSIVSQLRTEMHLGMEALGADIRKVLEMVMLKHDATTKPNATEISSSSRVAAEGCQLSRKIELILKV